MDTKLRVKGVRDDPKEERYNRQFKMAAAKIVLKGERIVVDLSRKLGIKDATLRRWAKEYEEMGEDAFPGNGAPKMNKDYEILKLRKQVEELERKSGLLKNPGLLGPRPCVRYRFLKGHRGDFGPTGEACELMGVSKSGYCEYLGPGSPVGRWSARRSKGSWKTSSESIRVGTTTAGSTSSSKGSA